MTTSTLRVLLTAILLALGVPHAEAAVSCWVLGNGLRVVMKEDHSFPVVAVNLVVRAGSGDEQAEEAGVSHLLEHMLFKGSQTRGKGDFQREIESTGGTINGATTRDYTRFYLTVGSRFLPVALTLLCDAVSQPALAGEELLRERTVVLDEVRTAADNPLQALWDMAYGAAFKGQPYGRPVGGSAETLSRLGREELADYHRRYYVPGNMSLVLVGDLQPERALMHVTRTFGSLPAARVLRTRSKPEPAGPAAIVSRRFAGKQEWLMLAFPAPGGDDCEEVPALDLLVTALATGYSSRLNQEWQQAHGVSGLRVQYLTHRQQSLMGIAAACAPGRWQEVRRAILTEVSRLGRERMEAEELRRAVRVLCGRFAMGNESFADQAETLGFYEALGSYTMALEYSRKVQAVQAERLQQVAARYLRAASCITVVMGP